MLPINSIHTNDIINDFQLCNLDDTREKAIIISQLNTATTGRMKQCINVSVIIIQ